MDSGRTPEEVCEDDPDLCEAVRDQWRRTRAVETQLEAMFPTPNARTGTRRAAHEALRAGAALPAIDGYAVEELIGLGGMGVVYRARHHKLNRVVAIKMVLLGPHATPHELECLMREAEAVAGLRHENIVRVYDVGELHGLPYFTMEYVEGGTLAARLSGTPQPADEAARLIATIAEGVQAAHQGGIVHRDLKPANILLTAQGVPKIADFSLARRLESDASLTLSSAAMGTPSYMAPEQAAGLARSYSPAVDVYSIGAMLYEVLTGRPPFRAESPAETQRQVISVLPAPPSRLNAKVPKDLETICLKCLEKAPPRRYASAQALADDLRRFLRAEPIAARRAGRPERCLRWARRNPTGAALLATGLLLLTVAVGTGIREWTLASQRRAETARWASRLEFVLGLQQQGRFIEAQAILGRIPDGGSAVLRRQIDLARADLHTVEQLDAIRLGRGAFLQGGGIDYARSSSQYEAAFAESGFGRLTDPPGLVADRLRASPVRLALVAALDDWAVCALAEPRAWILEVARLTDPDPWRNRVRDQDNWANLDVLAELATTAAVETQPVTLMVAMGTRWRRLGGDPSEFLQRVQRQHPDDFWVNFELGHLLGPKDASIAAGYCRAALAVRPHASAAHYNLAVFLLRLNQADESLYHLRRTIEIDPNHTWAYKLLGTALMERGLLSEASTAFQHVLRLDPSQIEIRNINRSLLIRQGRGEEARAEWGSVLRSSPDSHEEWDGYAELCLLLGHPEEYELTRQELLARFGASTDPFICERTGRTCLLLPATETQIRTATALIDLAVKTDSPDADWAHPYFLFAKSLAELRAGRNDEAIRILQGEAGDVLGPAPGLVVGMAQFHRGDHEAARRTLAAAVSSFDWTMQNAGTREAWLYHLLRREAEALIPPIPPN